MQITLYSFSKRENSTKRPTGGSAVECVLKESTSIYTPSFRLNTDPSNYNYCKWNNRYYYITDSFIERTGVYRIECSIDIMATWKEDIGNTTAFVMYSTSQFNTGLPDTRLSTDDNIIINSVSADILNNDGCYFVSFVGTSSNNHLVVKTAGEFNILCSKLMADELYESLLVQAKEYLSKKINSASDTIIEAHYLPFTPELGGSMNILLGGGYNTQVRGHATDHNTADSVSISIPWNFNDFRNRSQYTSLILYLPGYGAVNLNADDFIGKKSIAIDIAFDPYSGGLSYLIAGRMKCDCNVAVPIQVGTSTSPSLSSLVGSVSSSIGIGGAAGGAIGALGGAFASILSTMERNYGSVGSNGGSNSYDIEKQVKLYVLSHDTNIGPSSMASVQGRPLKDVKRISALSGYIECINASVNTDAPEQYKSAINSMLNGGFYYE